MGCDRIIRFLLTVIEHSSTDGIMDPKERKLSAFAHRKTRIAYLGSVWHQAGENIRHWLHSRSPAALPAAGRPALLVHRHARSRLDFSAILSPHPPAPSSACKAIMLQTTAVPAAPLPAASSPGAPAFPPPTQQVEHNKQQFACFATLRVLLQNLDPIPCWRSRYLRTGLFFGAARAAPVRPCSPGPCRDQVPSESSPAPAPWPAAPTPARNAPHAAGDTARDGFRPGRARGPMPKPTARSPPPLRAPGRPGEPNCAARAAMAALRLGARWSRDSHT